MAAQRSNEGSSEERPSPVVTAVLALVIERPSYGYELSRRFEERFGALYPVSRSRIYQVLDRLLKQALIERMPTDPEQHSVRQPKPHYRATPDGARLHREWIATTLRADPRREELLLRLLATGARDVRTMLQIVDVYQRACLDDMARNSNVDDVPARASAQLRDLLIAEEARLAHEARLKFIAFARRHIRAEIDGEDVAP